MRNKFILFLLFLCAFNVSFCFTVKAEGSSELQNTIQQIVPVNSITLDESYKVIELGKTITINAIISPDNATNKELIWSTSNNKVVSVDNKGSITALKQGVARIIVKTVDGVNEVTCDVTVVGHKGWILENEKWYYYDSTSTKKTGWLLDSGVWYYLNSSGDMKTGWQQDKGNWYYLNTSGEMKIGWQQDKSNWYYLNAHGVMQVDWKQDGNSWYFLNASGVMEVGWKYSSDSWYYLNTNGEMKTGWLLDRGTWYYFYNTGKMASNPENLSSITSYYIIVDSKNQAVNIYSGYAKHWNFIRTMSCSTGAAETPTIKGFFTIQSRGDMFRAASNTICKYYTGFSGNYLFHTVLLDNNGKVQDPTLGVAVSHGCVRLAIEDAMYIYNTIPYGTTVWSN